MGCKLWEEFETRMKNTARSRRTKRYPFFSIEFNYEGGENVRASRGLWSEKEDGVQLGGRPLNSNSFDTVLLRLRGKFPIRIEKVVEDDRYLSVVRRMQSCT
jgi:hypothetical protein